MEEPYVPELVSGIFTVNDSGKKVKFTKGNLYWNGSEFRCESNQNDYPTTRNTDHIGHFFWSKTASVAYAASYNDPDKTTSDVFFAADGGAIDGFTVLSKDEWDYLISHSIVKNPPITKRPDDSEDYLISIAGKNCIVLMSDGFKGTVKVSYTAEEWANAEASGLVALPFAGYYSSSSIGNAGSYGYYLPSTPDPSVAGDAWNAYFNEYSGDTSTNSRNSSYSVRLVSVQ